MSKDTGGPAFPTKMKGPNLSEWLEPGMTLRDYFAAKAMQAMIVSIIKPEHVDGAVEAAYIVADAMLAERAK